MRNFRESLLQKLNETGISLRQVAEGSGVSYEQLKKIKQIETRSTNVEDAMKVAHYFGLTLDELMTDQEASGQLEIIGLLESLSVEARTFLINAAKAQLVAEQSVQRQPDEDPA
jgi:transcriptional regulator with XRE-family HTH domain